MQACPHSSAPLRQRMYVHAQRYRTTSQAGHGNGRRGHMAQPLPQHMRVHRRNNTQLCKRHCVPWAQHCLLNELGRHKIYMIYRNRPRGNHPRCTEWGLRAESPSPPLTERKPSPKGSKPGQKPERDHNTSLQGSATRAIRKARCAPCSASPPATHMDGSATGLMWLVPSHGVLEAI